MLTKSMIAITAVIASLAALPAGEAQARASGNDFYADSTTNIGGIGVGYGPSVVPTAGVRFQAYSASISCGQARNVLRGNGFYNVTALDCSAPSFRFVAWQDGSAYRVRVNGLGRITGVSPL
jgi:hypothetical protein